MGNRATSKLADLVILNGQSTSNIWMAREVYEDARRITLTGEAVADGAITYSLEVTDDAEPSAASPWRTFQILNGAVYADLVLPNVNTKAITLPEDVLAFTGIRAKSSANVTGNRTFGASKQYEAN